MSALQPALSHPKYRPDIDGLRAIAVLSVVAFHAFPGWVKGGFVGVDIFFVISGFLISTIILENLEKGTFSFAVFYSRRVKRIFPALVLVLAACYTFGWFALFAEEYKQLGRHIAGGAGFISNIVLWNESGYFDNSADTKPLLHLWSLGVEEQFYIVWPLLLWLAWKWRLSLLAMTVLIGSASFYLNVNGIWTDAVATFYSPQTRFWELLCGSVLAWACLYRRGSFDAMCKTLDGWLASAVHRKKQEADGKALSNAVALAGLLLLAYGFWRINTGSNFPGVWALVPVLGATLILVAGPSAWINRTVLSNKVAVWFGLISYPLYLWHWPLLSFARIMESGLPSRTIRIAAVAAAIGLAWLTYELVERPIRHGTNTKRKVAALVLLMIVGGCIGYVTYGTDGLPFRTKEREEFIGYYENSFPGWKYFKRINLDAEWRSECAYFNGKKYREEGKLEGGVADSKPVEAIDPSCHERDGRFDKSVLVWGDSHAQALSPGLIDFMPKNWQVLQIATSGCRPNPNIDAPSSTSQCNHSNYFAIKTIKEARPDVVVIAQARDHSAKTMGEIAEKLEALGVNRVLFIGPTPHWTADLPKILARQLWTTTTTRTSVGINKDVMTINAQ